MDMVIVYYMVLLITSISCKIPADIFFGCLWFIPNPNQVLVSNY